ncbi:MAG: PQQ-dependent sugar dehydrogenase [Alphaproteobacteria bacterium]|nr:PQQ-dependent sugar dehydrogenase [Alphaproteobacteria bacterium]
MRLTRRSMAIGLAAMGAGRARAQSRSPAVRATPVVRDLQNPWSLAFLPDGAMLVTERPGRLRLVPPGGATTSIDGVPAVWARGQGGLLDVCLHPDFASNRLVYLSYAAATPEGAATRVARARLQGTTLAEPTPIFEAGPRIANNFHFGCRLAFDRAQRLYATIGERYSWRDEAQNLADLRGKVVRLMPDGAVPPDNPFVGRGGTRPEIFSYGHRNPQGLAMHPETGAMWCHEHGPRGGDEVNVLRAGGNFGWPRATHGVDYSGAVISEHKTLPGMVDPIWVWVPSIAPSGMAFCTSSVYPGWRGSLFIGALAGRLLVRLELDGERVVREERLLERQIGRIRDVRQGPDGRIYVVTDSDEGAVLRLDPV